MGTAAAYPASHAPSAAARAPPCDEYGCAAPSRPAGTRSPPSGRRCQPIRQRPCSTHPGQPQETQQIQRAAERVIRSLNRIIERLARKQNISLQHIQPGQPQQNAYIERYNRTVRHEWLDQHIIETIEEAQDFATQWLWAYNNDRPNMGIGGITPAQKLKMAA